MIFFYNHTRCKGPAIITCTIGLRQSPIVQVIIAQSLNRTLTIRFFFYKEGITKTSIKKHLSEIKIQFTLYNRCSRKLYFLLRETPEIGRGAMNPFEISNVEKEMMIHTLKAWASINTHCSNLKGLEAMLSTFESAFAPLGGTQQRIKLPDRFDIDSSGQKKYYPVGEALHIKKNPNAPFQILLAGHMDTVFEETCPFQKVIQIDENRLLGPGVADMKGGIQVMLKGLELLEQSQFAKNIGWQILLTPDEEIGSPSSESLYSQIAKDIHVGLVFEPSFPDGKFVSQRKGSINLIAIAKGKSAHAGRDFHIGRNAIAALAYFISAAHSLNRQHQTMTLNIGKISGGEASNIVPDHAICHINIRSDDELELISVSEKLNSLAQEAALAVAEDGITIQTYPLTQRAPKPFDSTSEALYRIVQYCGTELGLNLDWKPSGGVCDGNILAQAGVPTIDTLGVIGGNLHTFQEYMEIHSLVERASLTAHLLITFASQEKLRNTFIHPGEKKL